MALAVTHEQARRLVRRDLCELAPAMKAAVLAMLADCVEQGIDAYVYEARRTHELAAMYYALGSSKARDGWRTWHFYSLAVDIISRSRGWSVWPERDRHTRRLVGGDPTWYEPVVAAAKKHGLDWGGDWTGFHDAPHFQWHRCKPSPSDEAVRLYKTGGLVAVWRAVGALGESDLTP
jgi:peptidoglycan L-alanyl-D-glutamate endopeptidase CwlK